MSNPPAGLQLRIVAVSDASINVAVEFIEVNDGADDAFATAGWS